MNFINIFFWFYFVLIFLSNVFVSDKLPQLSFYLVLFFPIFLYVILLIKKHKITFPKVGIYLLIFLLLSSISIIFSVDKQVAFETFLTYLSAFLVFILSFNKREALSKPLQSFFIIISILSAAIFFINWYFKLNLFQDPQSLLYPGYYHNQISDVLILGIIVFFYNNSLFYILLFPFFIFTYSRTAYLSLISTGTIYLLTQKLTTAKKYLLFILILTTVIISLLIIREFNGNFPIVKNYLTKTLKVPADKSFSGERELHFSYAIAIIKDRPLFGLGPGNFFYGVLKHQVNFGESTTTAHNIILDIFAENGIPAGIFFLMFIIFILIKSKKNLYFYLFISLMIIFMFDFGYLNNFLLITWFILAALMYDETTEFSVNITYPIIFLFLSSQMILSSQLLYLQGNYKESLMVYPLNTQADQILTNEKKDNYNWLNFQNPFYNRLLGNYFLSVNKNQKALSYYQEAISEKPLLTAHLLSKIFYIQVKLKGDESSRQEMGIYINNLKNIKNYKNSDLMKIIKSFCRDYKLKC